jgi:hypothetical protein
LLVAGVAILPAEPLEADAARSSQLTPIAAERETQAGSNAGPLRSGAVGVAFSASQSETARVLLAQELGGESNRAVGTPSFPAPAEAVTATRRGEAEVRQSEAAEAKVEEESAIVGRSLRAFTRDQEEADPSSPRRRASFSSAISRAAPRAPDVDEPECFDRHPLNAAI